MSHRSSSLVASLGFGVLVINIAINDAKSAKRIFMCKILHCSGLVAVKECDSVSACIYYVGFPEHEMCAMWLPKFERKMRKVCIRWSLRGHFCILLKWKQSNIYTDLVYRLGINVSICFKVIIQIQNIS